MNTRMNQGDERISESTKAKIEPVPSSEINISNIIETPTRSRAPSNAAIQNARALVTRKTPHSIPAGWEKAVKRELDALVDKETFKIVSRQSWMRPISARWVLTTKTIPNALPENKALLVLRGFQQVYGINYFETYAPTARPESVRLVYSLAAQRKLRLYHLDIKTAFLNGKMDVPLFCNVPPYLHTHTEYSTQLTTTEDPVLQIVGSLYGSKQAQRIWHKLYQGQLIVIGFKPTIKDPCLYWYNSPFGIIIVPVYVDDNLVATEDERAFLWFESEIKKHFEVSRSGLVERFLADDVFQDPVSFDVYVTQSTYIANLLDKFNMSNAKPAPSPCAPNVILQQEMGNSVDATQYRMRVGALIFLAGRRFDISYAVNSCARFMHDPREGHLTACKRILRYLAGTRDQQTLYSSKWGGQLCQFSDSDWGGDRDGGRSTTGNLTWFCGPINHRSSLQPTPSLSTAEAEYVAASESVQDVCFFRDLYLSRNLLQ